MKQSAREIMKLYEEVPSMDGIVEVRGNLDFISILNSYPQFVAGKQSFHKKKRGRPAKKPAPKEIDYLVFLVEELYHERGLPYTRDDRRALKDLLCRAADGADFFDPVKAKHWIDIFSALDFNLSIFSHSEEAPFSEFFNHYVTLYSKLNSKKIVPFYARWITEISAMYTIYLHGTIRDFEEIKTLLQTAQKESVKGEARPDVSWQETNTIRRYLMANIFIAYGKKKDEVLGRLCRYISDNPKEFAYESGKLNKRYRRYYCTIREMLVWIGKQRILSFENDELIKAFTEEAVDYELKDSKVKELETLLVKRFFSVYQLKKNVPLTQEEQEGVLHALISETALFDEKTGTEIVCELPDAPFERKRTTEESVDSIVKLLRLFIILICMHRGLNEALNDYETFSPEDEIDYINQVMKRMGLLPLPTKIPSSYSEKARLDLSVVLSIAQTFGEAE